MLLGNKDLKENKKLKRKISKNLQPLQIHFLYLNLSQIGFLF